MQDATLWRFNRRAGYWQPERGVTNESAAGWLEHFARSYPEETFQVSKRKPRTDPPRK